VSSTEIIILIFVGQSFQGFFVNIARGLVVNEQELVKALVEEWIAGAGIEPQVLQELWNMENVVLLPHTASTTQATVKLAVELIISNLDAHFSGKPLLTPCVDDKKGAANWLQICCSRLKSELLYYNV
jgi:phosphoglycerate dehydrogenase-like enzyme